MASIEMWNARIANELMLPLAHGFRHTHPGMKELENQNEEFGLAQREVAKKSLAYFEGLISNREFIANRRLTQIGLDEEFTGVSSPFPWMSEIIDLRKEKNFFETRVTEYQVGGALNWE